MDTLLSQATIEQLERQLRIARALEIRRNAKPFNAMFCISMENMFLKKLETFTYPIAMVQTKNGYVGMSLLLAKRLLEGEAPQLVYSRVEGTIFVWES